VQEGRGAEAGDRPLAMQFAARQTVKLRVQLIEQRIRAVDVRWRRAIVEYCLHDVPSCPGCVDRGSAGANNDNASAVDPAVLKIGNRRGNPPHVESSSSEDA